MLLHESIVHYIGYIIIGTSFIMALWTMVDARKRDSENPTKWLFIVLILNVLGLLVYILQRPGLPADLTTQE